MTSTTQQQPSLGPVPEAPMTEDDLGGKRPAGPGWYVLNVADAEWRGNGTSACCTFEGDPRFGQYATNIHVLGPGEPSCMYHREYYDDESFFVLSGACTLVVEGEERILRAGDFVYCPAGTAHVFANHTDERCAIFMFGGRGNDPDGVPGCEYVADPVAAKHRAAPGEATTSPEVAYAGWAPWEPVAGPWWTPGAS